MISTLGWILAGVAAWLVVATALGILIGRTIRLRDQQLPEPPPDCPAPGPPPQIPVQKSGKPGSRPGE